MSLASSAGTGLPSPREKRSTARSNYELYSWVFMRVAASSSSCSSSATC